MISVPNYLELIKWLRMNDRKAYHQLRRQFRYITNTDMRIIETNKKALYTGTIDQQS